MACSGQTGQARAIRGPLALSSKFEQLVFAHVINDSGLTNGLQQHQAQAAIDDFLIPAISSRNVSGVISAGRHGQVHTAPAVAAMPQPPRSQSSRDGLTTSMPAACPWQPPRHAATAVALGGLYGVTKGMTEIEDGADTALTFIRGNHAGLVAAAALNRFGQGGFFPGQQLAASAACSQR